MYQQIPLRTHLQSGAALLIFILILLLATSYTFFGGFSKSRFDNERQATSTDALEQAKDALIGYAATYRDTHATQVFGYLPCPDQTGNGAATTPCNNHDEVSIGLLPYKDLGLPALRDSNGECLWYAVSGGHKNNPKSTEAFPLGTMNADAVGHIKITDLNGNPIATPSDSDGGTVAVVFSPGPPRGGAPNRTPINTECSADPTLVSAYLDGGYAAANTASVTSPLTITAGKSHNITNNDLLTWITPRDIFFRTVRLRMDYRNQINSLLSNLQAALQSASLPTPESIFGVVSPPDKNTGRLPLGYYLDTNSPLGYFSQFRDQILYAVCNPATRCFTVNGATCTGVMIYGGDRAIGQSRATDTDRNNPSNYLEASNLIAFTTAGAKSFSGNTDYLVPNAQIASSTDVVRCLNPPGPVSFAADIEQLSSSAPTLPEGDSMIAIDSSNHSLTLGATGVTDVGAVASQLLGCSWFNDTRPFLSGIRAYMEVQLIQTGDGFTFSIVDGEKNPSSAICGAAGQHLGYSGEPPAIPGLPLSKIQPPKIALEFDFVANVGFDESLGDFNSGRQDDPALTPHAAFVFWGNSSAISGVTKPDWDDNVHGFGKNPLLTVRNSVPFAVNGHVLVVRIEIIRNALFSTYTLKAWIYDATDAALSAFGGALLSKLKDTSTAMGTTPPPTLRHNSIKLEDPSSTDPFRNIHFGFTNGQSTSNQQIVIRNFEIRNIP